MECKQIEVNGKTFKYKDVFHTRAGCYVMIGSKGLENELVDEDDGYAFDGADKIDDMFYGYVEDDLFDELSYEEFEEYVNLKID